MTVLSVVLPLAAACEDELKADVAPEPPTTAEGVEPTLERGIEVEVNGGFTTAVEKWGSEPFTDVIRGDFGDDFRIYAICRSSGEMRIVAKPARFSRAVKCDEVQSGQRITGLTEPIELRLEIEPGTMWKVVVATAK